MGSPAQVSGGELAQRVRRFARSFKVRPPDGELRRSEGTSPTQADRNEKCRLHCRIVPVPWHVLLSVSSPVLCYFWDAMITEKDARYRQDFYEILQLTSNVGESFDRAYKILARQYHPDNQQTGDPARFIQIFRAGKILSDVEPRASHDRGCEDVPTNALTPLDETSEKTGYEGDQRLFDRILSLLYAKRRKNLKRSGMGIVQLEEVLGHSSDDLEFHLWYLREKGCVERLENGLLAITANGVDRLMEKQNRFSRRNRRSK